MLTVYLPAAMPVSSYTPGETIFSICWCMEDQTKGRNRVQVDVDLNMIATSDGDRCSLVSFSHIGVIGNRIGDVKGAVHEGRRNFWVRLGRGGMYCIPRPRTR